MTSPAHHRQGGGYRNPWPGGEPRGFREFLRWRRARFRTVLPTAPEGSMPVAQPANAQPRTAHGEIRITWVGHASFLIQTGGFNVLTDPVWSDRVSPLPWLGPKRIVRPGLPFEALPPIDAVLLSHDHYDHLDAPTVRRLTSRFGRELVWYTPLGYRRWLMRRGARVVHEMDWWQATTLRRDSGEELTITAYPAQHWTQRTPLARSSRLWASFGLDAGSRGRVYFGGDSGYCPVFTDIGTKGGPFDAVLLPIGAYAPRWFMKSAHMDPAEAVRAWHDLGASGRLVPMHWGTFILSDEPVLEPVRLLREAWAEAEKPTADLSILRHGETLILDRNGPDTGT